MATSQTRRRIDFEQVLPLLVCAYQRGRLVPFLGAGMSYPRLHLWKEFVANLEDRARDIMQRHAQADGGQPALAAEPVTGSPEARANQFTGRAQRASTVLRNACDPDQFFKAVQSALLNADTAVPEQTEALAAIAWPLVITTNYDDLYYGACRCSSVPSELSAEVLGRSPLDCKRLVSSLNGPFDRQYIWHIQGFLGGQHPDKRSMESERIAELREQLVIGHAEYRRVANTAAQFHRCFGEIFRTRSFLFLGSSLTEDYFLNMFSEVLELVGPSPVPHFALTLRGTVDVEFLADQMNITVCELDDWNDLPRRLAKLKCGIEASLLRTVRWALPPAHPTTPRASI
jgi:hypothetical protein